MRVLVAGDRGYIEAVLVPFLQRAGHQVDGLDVGLNEGCDFGAAPEGLEASQLADYDAVICLAALDHAKSARSGEGKSPRAEPVQAGESPGVGGARMGRS